MSSSETPDIPVDKDGLLDPNYDGYFKGREYPLYDEEDPYVRDLGIGCLVHLAKYRTVLVVWSTTLPVYGLALHETGVE